MADSQNWFTPTHTLIRNNGPRPCYQLNIVFLKTKFGLNNLYLVHAQLVIISGICGRFSVKSARWWCDGSATPAQIFSGPVDVVVGENGLHFYI